MLTQAHLKECLSYDPDAGIFTWLNRPESHFKTRRAFNTWNSRFSGKITGYKKKEFPYLVIRIGGINYKAHRLAFLFMTGSMPPSVDHINGIRFDNRWINLREASTSENQKNASMRSDNKSGVTGVQWYKKLSKWVARITSDGEKIHLGYFDDIKDAIKARKQAERKYGFHANHGRSS